MLKFLLMTQFAGLVMFVTIEFLEHMDIFTDSFNSFLLSLVYILLRIPHYFNLLLGNIACAQADMLHAGLMIQDLPANSYWSLAGIGDAQLKINSLAVAFGGGVRVGLEDNIWYDGARTRLAKNADLLKRIHKLASANERNIMPSSKMRKLLNLEEGSGKYGRK